MVKRKVREGRGGKRGGEGEESGYKRGGLMPTLIFLVFKLNIFAIPYNYPDKLNEQDKWL